MLYTLCVFVGMPKLGYYAKILDNVFFLYSSVEETRAGKSCGGTGFFVSWPTPQPDLSLIYGITNWHIAVQNGMSVIRVNTHDGGVEIFEYGPEDWHFMPPSS